MVRVFFYETPSQFVIPPVRIAFPRDCLRLAEFEISVALDPDCQCFAEQSSVFFCPMW
jgi:hypothetical protein